MRNDPPGKSISSVSTSSGYDARRPAEAMTRSSDVCLRVGPIAVNLDMSRNRGDVGARPDTELAAAEVEEPGATAVDRCCSRGGNRRATLTPSCRDEPAG